MSVSVTVAPPLLSDAKQRGISRDLGAFALVVLWAVMSYAAAFRSFGVGRDYIEYLAFYDRIPSDLSTSVQRFEIGFTWLAWFFIYGLDLGYNWFALFVVSISLGIKFFLFWKYLKHPLLAAIYYCLIFYPIHEYTQVRTAIGLALGYLALHFAYEHRFAKAVIAFVAGVAFHTSVFVLLPVYLAAVYARRNVATLAVVAALILVFGFSSSLRSSALGLFSAANPLLDAYAQNRELQEISILSLNNLGLVLALIAGFAGGWLQESRYHALFFVISVSSVLAVIALAEVPMVAQRTKEVLYVATVFLAHRSSVKIKTLPAFAMLWATGSLLFYLNLQSDVLGGQ